MNTGLHQTIAQALQANGIDPTPDNVQRVIDANRRQKPEKPMSPGQQALMGVGSVIATGAGSALGQGLGAKVAGALGTGITGAAGAGAGTTGATTALAAPQVVSTTAGTTAAGTGTAGAGLAGTALPVLGAAAFLAAAGASGNRAYQSIKGGNRGAGQKSAGVLGAILGAPLGGPIGSGVGATVAALLARGLTGGKDKYQMARDDFRDVLQEKDIIDDNYMYDGVDIGKDGGFKFDDGRSIYEIIAGQEDQGKVWEDAQTAEAVSALNAIGALTAGGFKGERSGGFDTNTQAGQNVGMLYNMFKENDGEVTRDELTGLYDKFGGQADIFAGLNDLVAKDLLDQADASAMQNSVNQAYGKQFMGLDEDNNPLYKDYLDGQWIYES